MNFSFRDRPMLIKIPQSEMSSVPMAWKRADVTLTLKGFFLGMARHHFHSHFLAHNKTQAILDFKGKWKC